MATSKTAIVGLISLLASSVTAQQGPYFVLGTGMPVTIERVDPLLGEGQIPSQHVHAVVGGNAFASIMDFSQTQKSNCSTAQPIADKSNYWTPILYFQDPTNHSFIRVPEQPYMKIYYKYGKGDNEYDTDIQEFPKEFRMMAGDATLRSENSTLMGTYGMGLEWFCHANQTAGSDISSVGFPTGFTSCPGGYAASMRMPSCWNGEDFNASNPMGHMAYPVGDGIGGCPEGYRVARFPQIFAEHWFNIDTFDGLYTANDQPFVLSFGDTTGFGFHMDFINGWAPGVLNATMKTCNPGNTGTPPLDDNTCFGQHGGIYSDDEIAACMKPPTLNEDIGWTYPERDNPIGGPLTTGRVLDQLPGCQTLTGGPGPASLETC